MKIDSKRENLTDEEVTEFARYVLTGKIRRADGFHMLGRWWVMGEGNVITSTHSQRTALEEARFQEARFQEARRDL